MSQAAKIDRVRKLLKRASRPTSENDHEAALAGHEAARLMSRYRLSDSDVAEVVLEVADDRGDVNRRDLAFVVAAGYGCTAAQAPSGAIAFRGRKPDAEKARDVYRDLARIADHMSLSECIDSRRAAWEAWKLCFWIGFTDSILQKFLNYMFPDKSLDKPKRPGGSSPAAAEALAALERLGYDWQAEVEDIGAEVKSFMQKAYESGHQTGASTTVPNPHERTRALLGSG